MSLYHVNPETGIAAICHAEKGKCPYGGATGRENHYKTLTEAKTAGEQISKRIAANQYNNTLSKTPSQATHDPYTSRKSIADNIKDPETRKRFDDAIENATVVDDTVEYGDELYYVDIEQYTSEYGIALSDALWEEHIYLKGVDSDDDVYNAEFDFSEVEGDKDEAVRRALTKFENTFDEREAMYNSLGERVTGDDDDMGV